MNPRRDPVVSHHCSLRWSQPFFPLKPQPWDRLVYPPCSLRARHPDSPLSVQHEHQVGSLLNGLAVSPLKNLLNVRHGDQLVNPVLFHPLTLLENQRKNPHNNLHKNQHKSQRKNLRPNLVCGLHVLHLSDLRKLLLLAPVEHHPNAPLGNLQLSLH
jgi:hypothetical protein